MHIKLWHLLTLYTTIMLSSCGGSNASTSSIDTTPKKWTYMVYMAADNNLSSSAIADLNEMERIGSNKDINVVVEAEFQHSDSPNKTDNTKRGKIEKDNNVSKVTSLSSTAADMPTNMDMGKKETLSDFIQWAKTNYPAENYALVLWSHGDGWKAAHTENSLYRGALEDTTSHSFMTTGDIAQAITNAGGVAVLDFDVCLMGMYEVAYQMRNSAQWLIASADLTPSTGNQYTQLLSKLMANPTSTPLALAQLSVTSYQENYKNYGSGTPKSIINLSEIEALHQSILQLAARLHDLLHSNRTEIALAKNASFAYDEPGNLDLLDLLKQLQLTVKDTLLSGIIDSTIKNLTSSTTMYINSYTSTDSYETNKKQLGGLAIYFPTVEETSAATLGLYSALDIKTANNYSWSDFLYNQLGNSGVLANLTNKGGFSYKLTWDDPAADLDLIVGEPRFFQYARTELFTSDDGYFSLNSTASGVAEETYTAALNIEKGSYDILVNYYDYQGKTDTNNPTITATLWFKDPLNGINDYQAIQTMSLNFGYPAPVSADPKATSTASLITLAKKSDYSDWFYATALTRSLDTPSTASTSKVAVAR